MKKLKVLRRIGASVPFSESVPNCDINLMIYVLYKNGIDVIFLMTSVYEIDINKRIRAAN